jgi:hypothetical protein
MAVYAFTQTAIISLIILSSLANLATGRNFNSVAPINAFEYPANIGLSRQVRIKIN